MNFYEYLDLPQTATEAQIKKAFRTKAKTTHPDYNKSKSAFYEMVELNLIHDTLLNPTNRQAYDSALTKGMAGIIYPHAKHSTKQNQINKIYHIMRELFTYHCRICGIEMSSTWQGYCLFHYLEVSGQLQNSDQTFKYHGYTFHWQTPESTHNAIPKNYKITTQQILLYLSLLIGIILLLIIYTLKQIQAF